MSANLWNPKVSNLGFTKGNIEARKEQLLGRALLERELRDQITDTRLGEQLELARRRQDFEPIVEGVQQLTEAVALRVTPAKLAAQYRKLIEKAARPGAKGPSLQETLVAVTEDMKNRIANNDLSPEDVPQILDTIQEITEREGNWLYSPNNGFALNMDEGVIYKTGLKLDSNEQVLQLRQLDGGNTLQILQLNGEPILRPDGTQVSFTRAQFTKLFQAKPYTGAKVNIGATAVNDYNAIVNAVYGDRRGRFLLNEKGTAPAQQVGQPPAAPKGAPPAPPKGAPPAAPKGAPPAEVQEISRANLNKYRSQLDDLAVLELPPSQQLAWAKVLHYIDTNGVPMEGDAKFAKLTGQAIQASTDMPDDKAEFIDNMLAGMIEAAQPAAQPAAPKGRQAQPVQEVAQAPEEKYAKQYEELAPVIRRMSMQQRATALISLQKLDNAGERSQDEIEVIKRTLANNMQDADQDVKDFVNGLVEQKLAGIEKPYKKKSKKRTAQQEVGPKEEGLTKEQNDALEKALHVLYNTSANPDKNEQEAIAKSQKELAAAMESASEKDRNEVDRVITNVLNYRAKERAKTQKPSATLEEAPPNNQVIELPESVEPEDEYQLLLPKMSEDPEDIRRRENDVIGKIFGEQEEGGVFSLGVHPSGKEIEYKKKSGPKTWLEANETGLMQRAYTGKKGIPGSDFSLGVRKNGEVILYPKNAERADFLPVGTIDIQSGIEADSTLAVINSILTEDELPATQAFVNVAKQANLLEVDRIVRNSIGLMRNISDREGLGGISGRGVNKAFYLMRGYLAARDGNIDGIKFANRTAALPGIGPKRMLGPVSRPIGEGKRRKTKGGQRHKIKGGQRGGNALFNEISRQVDGMGLSKAQKMAILRAASKL